MPISRNKPATVQPKLGPIVVTPQGEARLQKADAQKAEQVKAKAKAAPLDQMERGQKAAAASQVKSMGLRSVADANAAIARLGPALDLATQSLSAMKQLSAKGGALKKSTEWEARAVSTQVDALKEQLGEAYATRDFGNLLVDAAEAGRVSAQGKLVGEDIEKLDVIEPKMTGARAKGEQLEATAQAAMKTAKAFGDAEAMLEQFGVAPEVDLSSKEAAVGKAKARLSAFNTQLAALGGIENADADLQPQLRAVGQQLRASLGSAQKALLAETSKEELLNRAATILLDGPLDANAQRGIASDLGKIRELLAESAQLGQVAAKNVADLHQMRFEGGPDLGSTSTHQQKTEASAGEQQRAQAAPKADATASGAKQPEGLSALFSAGLDALDSVFPGAKGNAEQNIAWVSAFLSEADSKVGEKGWFGAAKEFVTGLDALLEEQDRQMRAAQDAAQKST